ncbi:hypothetical protein CPB86DRAFT_20007 [Serendipita vermifera]|nr:hypothetical protein CPB86DRAFT_20007 [Serendipita vermifera]
MQSHRWRGVLQSRKTLVAERKTLGALASDRVITRGAPFIALIKDSYLSFLFVGCRVSHMMVESTNATDSYVEAEPPALLSVRSGRLLTLSLGTGECPSRPDAGLDKFCRQTRVEHCEVRAQTYSQTQTGLWVYQAAPPQDPRALKGNYWEYRRIHYFTYHVFRSRSTHLTSTSSCRIMLIDFNAHVNGMNG